MKPNFYFLLSFLILQTFSIYSMEDELIGSRSVQKNNPSKKHHIHPPVNERPLIKRKMLVEEEENPTPPIPRDIPSIFSFISGDNDQSTDFFVANELWAIIFTFLYTRNVSLDGDIYKGLSTLKKSILKDCHSVGSSCTHFLTLNNRLRPIIYAHCKALLWPLRYNKSSSSLDTYEELLGPPPLISDIETEEDRIVRNSPVPILRFNPTDLPFIGPTKSTIPSPENFIINLPFTFQVLRRWEKEIDQGSFNLTDCTIIENSDDFINHPKFGEHLYKLIELLLFLQVDPNEGLNIALIPEQYRVDNIYRLPLLKLLLRHGANPSSALTVFSSKNPSKSILASFNFTDEPPLPLTFLIKSFHKNNTEVIELIKVLLEHDANPNEFCKHYQLLPLHLAIKNNVTIAIIELLYKYKVNGGLACPITGKNAFHVIIKALYYLNEKQRRFPSPRGLPLIGGILKVQPINPYDTEVINLKNILKFILSKMKNGEEELNLIDAKEQTTPLYLALVNSLHLDIIHSLILHGANPFAISNTNTQETCIDLAQKMHPHSTLAENLGEWYSSYLDRAKPLTFKTLE